MKCGGEFQLEMLRKNKSGQIEQRKGSKRALDLKQDELIKNRGEFQLAMVVEQVKARKTEKL